VVDRVGQVWKVYAYSAVVDHEVWKLFLIVESKGGQHTCVNLITSAVSQRPEAGDRPWDSLAKTHRKVV
jgi:hypothetical protein